MYVQLELPKIHHCDSLRQSLAWLLESLECSTWTQKMHADHARYLLTHFGDIPVTGITYAMLREYYRAELRRGRAKETIRKRLSTLKMALREAIAHGALERLPEFPVIKQQTNSKQGFWTRTQYEAIRLACDDEDLKAWIDVGWHTGMHTSDINRFRWQDVDLVRGTWVRRNTKNRVKPAVLKMPARMWELLKARHELLQPHPRDLVCGHNMGHPNRQLRELAERAGVPSISPIEATRHSCETEMERAGVSQAAQMLWLGLLTPKPLYRHYRHIANAESVTILP